MSDELLKRLAALPPEQQQALIADALRISETLPWHPLPGSQTQAYFSPADVSGFGGEAGGGKSALICGLAVTAHQRSLILRRTAKEAAHIADAIANIVGHRNGLNSGSGVWRLDGNRMIEFGGVENPGDEQKFKGRGHDLLAFDELTDFTRYQYKFLSQWNRREGSQDATLRCRILCTFNPPTRESGRWVVEKEFAPWLDPRHPNPAKSGEIRWFIDADGEDAEVDGPGPHDVDGRPVMARSRTFIRGFLAENPYLEGYDSVRAAAPKEMRAAYRLGSFEAALADAAGQLIPSAWVIAAQDRWTDRPPIDVPQTSIGVDCSGGGADPMVMIARHDTWFAMPVEIKGEDLPLDRLGSVAAGHVVSIRRDDSLVVVDLGGGYGGSLFECLAANNIPAHPYKGSEGTKRRTADRKLGFVNTRSAAYWAAREMLDPDQPGGSPAALPPDPKLRSELLTHTFEVTPRGVQVEVKEGVRSRLGHSPDRADAFVMALAGGPSYATHANQWRAAARQRRQQYGDGPYDRPRPQVRHF